MTHKDIYEKFMIEYDKANITSSYPSLTKYEIATILDKAYLALIAQKLTGNNQRKVQFEGDIKAIEDIRPLVKTLKNVTELDESYKHSSNDLVYNIPSDLLYYINSTVNRNIYPQSSIDGKDHMLQNVQLLDHNSASKYRATDTNLPWIDKPVCYIEGNNVHVLVDSYKFKNDQSDTLNITYIKKPVKFVDGDNNQNQPSTKGFTLDQSKLDSADKLN